MRSALAVHQIQTSQKVLMAVIIGVGPHQATHTVVAIRDDETELDTISVKATTKQAEQLRKWAAPLGEVAVGHPASALPKAGVFSERQAAVVADRVVSRIGGGAGASEHDGLGSCSLEFGQDAVARVEARFVSGDPPNGTYEAPSEMLAADKATSGSSRIRRWFDGTWATLPVSRQRLGRGHLRRPSQPDASAIAPLPVREVTACESGLSRHHQDGLTDGRMPREQGHAVTIDLHACVVLRDEVPDDVSCLDLGGEEIVLPGIDDHDHGRGVDAVHRRLARRGIDELVDVASLREPTHDRIRGDDFCVRWRVREGSPESRAL
jgi:hypothetical protein